MKEERKLLLKAIICIIIAPILFTRELGWISFLNTGQIGDTIGGITAPIVGITSIYFLYLSLKEQREFNKE